jgi:hypothetical protein
MLAAIPALASMVTAIIGVIAAWNKSRVSDAKIITESALDIVEEQKKEVALIKGREKRLRVLLGQMWQGHLENIEVLEKNDLHAAYRPFGEKKEEIQRATVDINGGVNDHVP